MSVSAASFGFWAELSVSDATVVSMCPEVGLSRSQGLFLGSRSAVFTAVAAMMAGIQFSDHTN